MTKKSKRALERRQFLKGLGTCLSLPLLESLTPVAFAQNSDGPIRLISLYVPNGLYADKSDWLPTATGANYDLSPMLGAFANFKADFSVVSNLRDYHGQANGDGAGDHARAASSYYTGARVNKPGTGPADDPDGLDPDGVHVGGPSWDQVAAKALGQSTRLPSLELAVEQLQGGDSGYPGTYKLMSWRDRTTPLPVVYTLASTFQRLFGDGTISVDQAAQRRAEQRSLLDFVASDASSLSNRLGKADREKLDQYLTSVREVERRLAALEDAEGPMCVVPDAPSAPANFQAQIETMMDLVAVALQCDATRVVTFALGNEGTNRSFGNLPGFDFSDGWHTVSHYGEVDTVNRTRKYKQINQWMVNRFPYFINKLKQTQVENGKTLWDQAIATFGSGIARGQAHDNVDLPMLVAGRGGGAINPGRHYRTAQNTPVANLWLTMLRAAGLNLNSFGDSTGTVTI